MSKVSESRPNLKGVQVLEVIEKRGALQVEQTSAIKICSALSGGLATWRSSKLHVNRSVAKGAKWVIPPYQSLKTLEIEQDTKVGYIRLDQSVFEDSSSDDQRNGLSLSVQENIHDATLDELVSVLLRESRNGHMSGLLFAQSLQTALAAYLLSRFPAEAPPSSLHKGGLSRKNLRRCLDYIEEHVAEEIGLDDLAREAGLSRSHLIRSFRQSTGVSPYQYVLRRRIEYAKTSMKTRHSSLTDVALACGFANQHHFSKVFRSVVGTTPSRYRAQHC